VIDAMARATPWMVCGSYEKATVTIDGPCEDSLKLRHGQFVYKMTRNFRPTNFINLARWEPYAVIGPSVMFLVLSSTEDATNKYPFCAVTARSKLR
jgi:hypothetical protein